MYYFGTEIKLKKGFGFLKTNDESCIFDRDPLDTIKKDMTCVTMLGDAMHRMSPFEEQGANQALIDAVTL